MDIDFRKITACSGDCSDCEHYISSDCCGCNQNGGSCIKMWENGCAICKCCNEHNVPFCGLCCEFPCEWLQNTLAWEKNGIERLGMLAEEFHKRSAEFSHVLPSLWKRIGTYGVMTLSTCSENRVTSRPISVIVADGKFYCQTDENYLKCQQIRKNPNAALCHKNFSIEGTCRIIGNPLQHDFFMKAMKKHYILAANRWSVIPTECVLEITPSLIYRWDYELTKPYMEYWDFENMSYRKEWK